MAKYIAVVCLLVATILVQLAGKLEVEINLFLVFFIKIETKYTILFLLFDSIVDL